jgi:hypothetical protein
MSETKKKDDHGGGFGEAISKGFTNILQFVLAVAVVVFVIWGGSNYLNHGTIAGQQSANLPPSGGGSINTRPSGRITGVVPPAGGTQAHVDQLRQKAGAITRY